MIELRPVTILKIAGVVALLGLAGCQTPEVVVKPTKEQRPPAEQLDFGRLKPGLRGKSQRSVLKMLGQPNAAYDKDGKEIWIYVNAAYDPKTDRVVNFLRIEFVDGRVKKIASTLAMKVW